MTSSRKLRLVLAVAASVVLLATAAVPLVGSAADHLDAPALNPGRLDADINDLYVFQGADPNATVLAMTVSPAAGAIGPATFGTDVLYQFNLVDAPTPSAFDVTADIAFRAIFDAPDSAGNQPFKLYKATGSSADGHSITPGDLFFSGLTNTVYDLRTGGKFFAGLRSDPFFFDLAGFQGGLGEANNNRAFNDGKQVDFFEDLNVLALVLELPDSTLPDQVFGPSTNEGFATWGSTAVQNNGGWDQVDRMGRPAINTVVNSTGTVVNAPSANKDVFNKSHPRDDAAFQQAVEDALKALSALDSEGVFDSSWLSLYTNVLLPDKLFFNKNDTSSFAVPGVFNGRRLEDDVIDIELNIVTGGNPLGLSSSTQPRDANGGVPTDGIGPHSDYLSVFPYLGVPHLPPPVPPPVPSVAPNLKVTKMPDGSVAAGAAVTFTVKVENTGDVDLSGISVTDDKHPVCDRNIGTLAAGAMTSSDCTVLALTSTVTNTATATTTLKRGVGALLGSNEVPSGSGDPNGAGSIGINFHAPDGMVCFEMDLLNLQGNVTAAHIHDGAAGANGPVAVNLDWPTNGTKGCVNADQTLIDQILTDLDEFYVNVHSDAFPAGAVRGQLADDSRTVSAQDSATVIVIPKPPTKPDTVGVIDQDQGLWYLVDPILADLNGDKEVPSGSGDPNGLGRAVVTFNRSNNHVCFDLELKNLQGNVTAAHIHDGAKGVNGPVVVDLDWKNNGQDGCVTSTQALIDQILEDLDEFYVNVHSDKFPAGAVRGQLGGGPLPPFFFGNPADDPFLGDWDGDGIDTPGMYRPSDGKVYLRNSNTPGIAEIEFFFGDPFDVPIIGDWDGDGDDTVSLYRPSEGKFYIINELGSQNRGLGAAEIEFIFGDPFDDPFAGDFDGDGKDSVGVRRGNVFYWRNSLSSGPADNKGLRFGDFDDEAMFGDWDGDGLETPGVYRPSTSTIFLRNLREPGIADMEIFADGFESGDTSAWSTGR